MASTPMPAAPRLSPAEMAEFSTILHRVAHNPRTRPVLAQLVRHASPQNAAAFNDVFLRQEFLALKKTIDDDRLKDKMERQAEVRVAQRNDIQKSRNLSDDQMKELEAIQTKFGFTDWKAAAAVYADEHPPENPLLKPPREVEEMGVGWEFPTVPGPDGKMLEFKDYIKDPRKYSNKTAIQMITDFKRGRLPAAFHAQ